jgi:nitroimidazol reductase NimA-like FMN-containing flavoprotein (pyridoxamine 5'-phosphate oxidase superfamily)
MGWLPRQAPLSTRARLIVDQGHPKPRSFGTADGVRAKATVSSMRTMGDDMKPSLPPVELDDMPDVDCLNMLSKAGLGRIAFVVDARQEIFPVNYVWRSEAVVFRTAAGTKLSHVPGSEVAFEIDEYDSQTGVGWSVVVHGVAYDVTDAEDEFSIVARAAHVYPVAPGLRPHVLAIQPKAISGRRFRRLVSEQFLG